jgi:hypothetical protein
MTCIVGVVENKRAYISSDSGAISNISRLTNVEKVFKVSNLVIGYTTSFRMGQLLKYSIVYPEIKNAEQFNIEFVINEIIPKIRECFKVNGFLSINNSVEEGGEFLISSFGKIFCIESDFQVQEFNDGIYTCGSGGNIALAVMKALKEIDPVFKILRAIEIVSEIDLYTKLPVQRVYYTQEDGFIGCYDYKKGFTNV